MCNASLCPQQCYSVGHTALEAQHLRCSCLISVLSVGYMVEKPSTADEAIAYVWDVPDTVIGPADKQRLAAALAEKTDAVARRYFSAPNPELWVGTLRELLKPAGISSRTSLMTCSPYVCCIISFVQILQVVSLVCGLRIAVDFSAHLSRLQHCIAPKQTQCMCVSDEEHLQCSLPSFLPCTALHA